MIAEVAGLRVPMVALAPVLLVAALFVRGIDARRVTCSRLCVER